MQLERAHTAWDTSADSRAKPPMPRWVGRCHAKWQEEPLLKTLYVGDKLPDLISRFEAAVAQPPIDQLQRTIHLRIYRIGVGSVDDDLALGMEDQKKRIDQSPRPYAPLVIPYKGIPRSKSPPPQVSQVVSRKCPKPEGEPVIVRRAEFDVPPVPGSRFSAHDIDTGRVEKAGIFTINLSFTAKRIMTTKTVVLETPPVEHPPLWFSVKPGTAVANQCQVWVLAPQQEVASPNGRSYWEQKASVKPESNARNAAGRVASLVSSGALASTPYGNDLPLTVEAGETVRVRVLTRDKFLNETSRSAFKRVTMHLDSQANDKSPLKLISDPTGPQAALDTGLADSTVIGGAVSKSEELERDWTIAGYKGNGLHEADFVRNVAGQYSAYARLRGELIPTGKGMSMKVIVVPSAVDPSLCECRELPQTAVDPRSIEAAMERDRAQQHRDHVRRKQGEGETALLLDDSWVYVPPACVPEGVIGTFEVVLRDRFSNLCESDATWRATLVAEETWEPEQKQEDRLPEYVPQRPKVPPPDGEAWVEPGAEPSKVNVRFRGQSGRYNLLIMDTEGRHYGASPFPVLIVPPAGGPRSARPHGLGARSAVADEWTYFLLRPSEFLGCEAGPCDASRELFDQLRISIVPVTKANAEPARPVGEGSALALRARDASKSPPRSRSPAKNVASPNRPPRDPATLRGITLPQPEKSKKVMVDVSAPEPEDLASLAPQGRRPDPSTVFIETHYGDGREIKRKKTAKGPTSQMDAPPPEVEPGAHMVRYRVKMAGDYKLHVAYGTVTLESSPLALNVVPALLSVDHCTVHGLCEQTGMMTAGREVTGMILLNDRCGNPVIPGPQVIGVPIRVVVEPIGPTLDPYGIEEQGSPQKIELSEEAKNLGGDLHVGATFKFSLSVAGWYRVTCSVANTQLPLPHGCYPLLVAPCSKPDPAKCRIEDAPEPDEVLPAGTRMSVSAVVRDRLGNVCALGGHELRATVRVPNVALQAAHSVPYARGYLPTRGLVVCDRRDGTYETIFTPQAVGQTTLIFAMANGPDVVQLGGKPMQFEVEPGLPSPPHCVAKGHGIRTGYACQPNEFEIEARDAAGNLTTERLELRVVMTPASSQQQLSVQAVGDGRHLVRYIVPVSGIYKLAVLVGDHGSVRPADRRHISQSPFTVPIHSGTKGGSPSPRGRGSMSPRDQADVQNGRPSQPLSARARSASPVSTPRGGSTSSRADGAASSLRRGETVRLGVSASASRLRSADGSAPAVTLLERVAKGTPNAQLFEERAKLLFAQKQLEQQQQQQNPRTPPQRTPRVPSAPEALGGGVPASELDEGRVDAALRGIGG